MLRKIPYLTLILSIILIGGCAESVKEVTVPSSLLIENALLYDGKGNLPIHGSIRINKGLIVALGELAPLPKENVWDANGLALAPGFIDPHSHHAKKFNKNNAPASVLAQGITTVVTGLDGSTRLPIDAIFEQFESSPAAVNLAAFGPHNRYRNQVMGDDFRRLATPQEITAMSYLLQVDLDLGVLGFSTGVEYEPAVYANTAELVALAKVAAKAGGRYTSHIRNEDVYFYNALEEFITIAREAKIPANISHIKLAMAANWGQADKVLKILELAIAEGLDITADIYPYDGWQTTMKVLLPEQNYDDRKAYEFALKSIALPETIIMTAYEPNPSYVGKTLAEIAIIEDITPVDMLMKMVKVTRKDKLKEKIIGRNISEKDIERFMKWRYTSISSDGNTDDLHPRGQGAFPRMLARYVRERGIMSLPEAIRKMTSLTAHSLGLKGRGSLEPGYAADLVLFSPEAILDHATFTDPVQYSTGIDAVWVAGKLVWHEGKATSNRPGKILRRAQ
ncbi:MAG: amidohydrolase family protein [Colwellia sp.]|nr:amidohydrolase family protein [Colwellia sp.]